MTDSATGISVTGLKTSSTFDDDTDLIVNTVVPVEALSDTTKYSAYQAYDLTFTCSGTATVSLPVPTDYPLDNTKVYHVDGNTLTAIDATITMVNGEKVAIFETTHNSIYAVVNEISTASPEDTTYTYYQRVISASNLISGGQYLIILDCSSQDTADRFVIPTIATSNTGTSQRKGPAVVDAPVSGTAPPLPAIMTIICGL